MKILLSAYACEPNRGSEPGVGWHWANEIEKLGHEVWVLTRSNNQNAIEGFFEDNPKPTGLNFIYFDVPRWLSFWKRGGRGIYLYYLLWQIGAYFVASSFNKKIRFDQVQHSTFVTIRQPSFMGFLGIPFILGPVGGGERAPYALRYKFGLRNWLKDFFRDVANFLVKFDPLMHATFLSSTHIYVTSEQSRKILPWFYRSKSSVSLAVGIDDSHMCKLNIADAKVNKGNKVLFVGRFEDWKGMGLGIAAFAEFVKKDSSAQLTMVGKGPEKKKWTSLVGALGIKSNVIWVDWVSQKELKGLYMANDILLFPSLHDSGGMVVLEALSNGMPVVCMDLGGPGVIVDDTCGLKVSALNSSESKVTSLIYESLSDIQDSLNVNSSLILGAQRKAKDMGWSKLIESIYPTEA